MVERTLYVLAGIAAALLGGWLIVTQNYAVMLVLACILGVLFLALVAVVYIIQPREQGLIGDALQRRSARVIAKRLIERARHR
jgi:hypothetical protein